AETKNGILLSINGLFLFRLLDGLDKQSLCNSNLNVRMIWILLIIFSVAIIITLKSFFPNCSVFIFKNIGIYKNDCESSRNLIFYGDISQYDCPKLYLKDIYRHYFNINIDTENLNKYELDYAEEILINSKIAYFKYKSFKEALLLNGIGILLLLIFLFIS
ncbi:hypothetical protein L0P56_12525, partial [Anaerosalibacter bizertensis]|nr:hypothetical protein [Anaerosalibacter bizertensis]